MELTTTKEEFKMSMIITKLQTADIKDWSHEGLSDLIKSHLDINEDRFTVEPLEHSLELDFEVFENGEQFASVNFDVKGESCIMITLPYSNYLEEWPDTP